MRKCFSIGSLAIIALVAGLSLTSRTVGTQLSDADAAQVVGGACDKLTLDTTGACTSSAANLCTGFLYCGDLTCPATCIPKAMYKSSTNGSPGTAKFDSAVQCLPIPWATCHLTFGISFPFGVTPYCECDNANTPTNYICGPFPNVLVACGT